MPLNPRVQAFLDQQAANRAGIPSNMQELSMEDVRRAGDMMVESWGDWGPAVAKIEGRLIPGPVNSIPIRIYSPKGSGPFPVTVYFHGGGFFLGGIATADCECRFLADTAGCMVVSVEYRLAPEYKFPAAVEDGYTATRWVYENADALNADAARVAVGGESSGGNLTAAVALMARDRGTPPLMFQLLMYPIIDFAFDTPSYQENAKGYMMSKDSMMWCWSLYLRTESDGNNPYASPLKAQDFHGLPPAFVVTAEYDPLRDEGESYAARLAEAGISVVCKRYEGWIHAGLPVDVGIEAWQEVATYLRSVFVS